MGAPLPYGVGLKRALDRGVVPHMGIPNESQFPAVGISHDHRLRDPIRSIVVLDTSGKEIHREPVHQDEREPKVAITFGKIG